ncbi:MAG: DEAD/DEAH box helicase [Bacteroidetes bacterium]|nr:DEAD/DEAH box helicase [Bacteroidota bacterium]
MPVSKNELDLLLARLGIGQLTKMQQQAIDAAETGHDIILISPTGSGKTLAFLIPLFREIKGWKLQEQALIVVPTRELALQIESVWKQMSTGFKATLCYGGHRREIEDRSLLASPTLIMGTPGRLCDHLQRGNFRPGHIRSLVLDEFDKSLELGFQEEMATLIGGLKSIKRRILCSATSLTEIPDFTGIKQPLRLQFSNEKSASKLKLQFLKLEEKDKAHALFTLLCSLGTNSSVVFLNHRQAVDRLQQLMAEQGIESVAYHGALDQDARELALAQFRNRSARTLIATDLAARGLDIAHIDAVIHYHLPADESAWTHRNGRTARMDAGGKAILLLGPDEHLPAFCPEGELEQIDLPVLTQIPETSGWCSLIIGGGKKDKLSKADIVGFLTQVAGLRKEEIGLIELKDYRSFIALHRDKVNRVIQVSKASKLKGQRLRFWLA